MIGELYARALAGRARPDIEYADGSRTPLLVEGWLRESPGDRSILERCVGPTLDIGSGPGRLTVALSERGIPALGIDITPYAVDLARSAGALVMLRDVFDRVPGTGRWMTVLLADGNIGIGGDPAALLRRVGELLARGGHALVEVQAPGAPLRCENVRLRREGSAGAWFPWAYVGADQIGDVARSAGLILEETWTASGRWFAALACEAPAVPSLITFAAGALAPGAGSPEAAYADTGAGHEPAGLAAEGPLAVLTIHYRMRETRP